LSRVTTFGPDNSVGVSLDIRATFSMMSGPLSCVVVIGLPALDSCLSVRKMHAAVVLLFFLSPCA